VEANRRQELFQHWLIDMDDALDRFMSEMPPQTRECLGFSSDSLSIIESWLLNRYENPGEAKADSEAYLVDGAARYVGETFRVNLGGKWVIDYSDSKNVFYGLPLLKGMRGQRAQFCPLAMVVASTARRTGNFIKKVFDNMYEDSLKK
jgi:hypothetical protein